MYFNSFPFNSYNNYAYLPPSQAGDCDWQGQGSGSSESKRKEEKSQE